MSFWKKSYVCLSIVVLAVSLVLSAFSDNAALAYETSLDLKKLLSKDFDGIAHINQISCGGAGNNVEVVLNIKYVDNNNVVKKFTFPNTSTNKSGYCLNLEHALVQSAESYGVNGNLKSSSYTQSSNYLDDQSYSPLRGNIDLKEITQQQSIDMSGIEKLSNFTCIPSSNKVTIQFTAITKGATSDKKISTDINTYLGTGNNNGGNACTTYKNALAKSAKGYGIGADWVKDNYVPQSGKNNGSSGGNSEAQANNDVSNSPAVPSSTVSNSSCTRPSTVTNTGTWKIIGPSTWGFVTESGQEVTGWQYLSWSGGNDWFYLGNEGAMQVGWQKLKWSGGIDTFYFHQENGNMLTGWQKISNNWYFFSDCGAMRTGWQHLEWNGKKDWYYFDETDGWMYEDDTTPDGFYVSTSGAWDGKSSDGKEIANIVSGEGGDWAVAENGKYYFLTNENRQVAGGWKQIDQVWYFFNDDGSVQDGWLKRGNNMYFYDGNTMLVNSWVNDSNGKKYYLNGDGTMAQGITMTDDGEYHCFTTDDGDKYASMQRNKICQY